MRKPEEFKIAALKDILRLFKGKNPFYAGFGNRITVTFIAFIISVT
jgi:phosphatidate phosphatase LPIN